MTAATLDPAATASPAVPATLRSRVRGFGLRAFSAVVSRLPERAAVALAEAAGEAWYRLAPARAAQGRLNLQRVCAYLAAHALANERVRDAATDRRALERLLRAAFRQTARYYVEVARITAANASAHTERLTAESPQLVDEIVRGGAAVIVGLHYGAIEMPAAWFAKRAGVAVTIPMETLDDPGLQAWFERTRGAAGVRIVGLREARRELLASLRRGEPVGLVGDRDLTGGGIRVPFFGVEASLPVGPGLLAIESGAPVYVVSVRRVAGHRYSGRLEPLPVPPAEAGTRRERLTAFLAAEAQAFERAIAQAPEQWWAVFFPIWPDLVARPRTSRLGSPDTGA